MIKPETVALRQRVYDLLDGACVDCGERDYDKLTIDHVHNNGGEIRRRTNLFGHAKYEAYLRHGIPRTGPEAVELRCYNCNLGSKKLSCERQDQKQEGRGSLMATKQINPSVSTHTIEGLEKLQKAWACPQGQAIDRLMVWYEEFAEWKTALISSLQSTPATPETPSTQPVLPTTPDPYDVLTTVPPTPQTRPLIRPAPKAPLWLRLFGARS